MEDPINLGIACNVLMDFCYGSGKCNGATIYNELEVKLYYYFIGFIPNFILKCVCFVCTIRMNKYIEILGNIVLLLIRW